MLKKCAPRHQYTMKEIYIYIYHTSKFNMNIGLNLTLSYSSPLSLLLSYIYIYCVDCMKCWIMMIETRSMMGWLSKLIVVDNLGCPKYKRNSAEFLVDFKKKNHPQIQSICWDLLTLIKSYSRVCCSSYHVKICMEVVSKTWLSKVIISYYFRTVLLEVKVGQKKRFEGLNKTN
jgi:hypothetical protein